MKKFYNPRFPKTVSAVLTAYPHGNLSVKRARLGGYYGVAGRFPVTRKEYVIIHKSGLGLILVGLASFKKMCLAVGVTKKT